MEKSWSKIKPIIRHFHVFGSEALAHIPDKKQKALQPKSEKCIFVRYFEDVKGYRLLQPHSNDIIIRRDVQLYENISCYNPNSTSMPFVSYDPSSVLVPFSTPNIHLKNPNSCPDDDSKDQSTPLPTHFPPIALEKLILRWVHTTCETIGDIARDSRD